MTTTKTPAQDVSDAAIAQAFNEYLDVHYGNKGADVVMTEIWERAKALTAQECVTGIADAVLLRSLCEDVPDMHHSVRTQLQALADKIDSGAKIGVTRCRRCGDKAEVTIHESRSKPPRTEMADEALMAEKTQREMNEFKNDPLPPAEAAARELQQAQVVDEALLADAERYRCMVGWILSDKQIPEPAAQMLDDAMGANDRAAYDAAIDALASQAMGVG